MRYEYLSYPLADELPVYGGKASLGIHPIKSIVNGDSANVVSFTIQNHWGTHIDCPAHFFEKGKKVVDYPPEFWLFKSPQVLDISLKPVEILRCKAWSKTIRGDTDILLFKSEWSNHRGEDIYNCKNPGIHPEVALYLRKNYPNIRVVGIDWLSISSYKDRELGREAHRAFLDPEGLNNSIAIIEDMDLSHDLTSLREVIVLPLRIDILDSAPCTIIGLIND